MNDVQSGKAPEHYDILLAGNSISVIMLAACPVSYTHLTLPTNREV